MRLVQGAKERHRGMRQGIAREIVGHSDVKVTMTVYAYGHLAEKAAALAQLGTAVAGALPSAVAVTPPADDHDGEQQGR